MGFDDRRADGGATREEPCLRGASAAFIASFALRSASFRYLRKISLKAEARPTREARGGAGERSDGRDVASSV